MAQLLPKCLTVNSGKVELSGSADQINLPGTIVVWYYGIMGHQRQGWSKIAWGTTVEIFLTKIVVLR